MARPSFGTRWKSWIARFTSAILLIGSLAGAFWVVNNEVAQRSQTYTPTVALVNEDLAANFNGKEYTFGVNFVDRISKDAEYNWTVVSRPVAEKAYKDGSVDAVIYLPQSFTQDLLTLQELEPTRATVNYKLQAQVDERADRLLDNKVVGIVSDFNRGVVQMYSASIADNVAEADGQMHSALSNQEALIAALTADVQEPFSGTMPNFENLIESTSGLKEVNSATTDAQNNFTESVTEALSSNSEALSSKLPEIEAYSQTQKDIAEANTTNSNKGIADQAASDSEFYGTQFDELRTNTLCQLSGHDADDNDAAEEPCKNEDGAIPPSLEEHLAGLRQSVTDYTGPAGSLLTDATTVRDTLNQRIINLESLLTLLSPPVVPEPPVNPEPPVVPDTPDEPTTPAISIDPAVLALLQEDIDNLKSARDLLDSSLLNSSGMPNVDFESQLTNVDTWYAEALKNTKDASLQTSTLKHLELKDWSAYDPDNAGLYVDNSEGLHQGISDLVTQSAETSGKIGESKLTVPDNSQLFDSLLKSATTTYDGADTVFDGVNDLLATGNTALGENQLYYQNFSTVLANTRTQGVDTVKIHGFLSAPIDAKNVTPARPTITEAFDPTSVLVFGGGLLAGVMVMVLGRTFRRRKDS